MVLLMTSTSALGQELYNHAVQNPFANYEEDLEASIKNFKDESGFGVQVITAYLYEKGQFADYVQSWRQNSANSGLLIALNPIGNDWSNDLKVVGAQDILESDQFNASGIQSVVDQVMIPILKEETVRITNNYGNQEELSFGAGLKYYKSIEIGLAEMLRRAPMTEVEMELPMVRFVPNQNQTYGFDQRDEDVPYGQYEQTIIDGETRYIPWKSIASGSSDKLDVHIQTLGKDVTISDVKYKTQTTTLQAQSGSSNNLKTLNLIGQFDGQEDELQAYYSYPDESQARLSTIRVKTYDQKRFNLVVVPVDGNSFPYSFGNLETQLNKTFNQAVVQWDLSLNNPVATDLNPNQAFDDGETGMLSNYTGDMKTVWRAFQDQYSKDNETYYLFLVRSPQSGTKIGYMPKKKQYGFVFLDNIHSEQHLVKTIAHELGHGAFRLSHPFSDYGHADRATANLMDYKDEGLTLKKYQWDNIHDPENMIALFQDEEEGHYRTTEGSMAISVATLSNNNPENFFSKYGFLTGSGAIIDLSSSVTKLLYSKQSGVLDGFYVGETRYKAVFADNEFLGYLSDEDRTNITGVATIEKLAKIEIDRFPIHKSEISKKGFGGIQETTGGTVYAKCLTTYSWDLSGNTAKIYDLAREEVKIKIWESEELDRYGSECEDNADVGVGIGGQYYRGITRLHKKNGKEFTTDKLQDIQKTADYLSQLLDLKSFAFFTDDQESYSYLKPFNWNQEGYTNSRFSEEQIQFFYDHQLFSTADFDGEKGDSGYFDFHSPSRDFDIIFSSVDLWKDIPDDYNANSYDYIRKSSPYQYSFRDLAKRYELFHSPEAWSTFITLITEAEGKGYAEAISLQDGSAQFIEMVGTNAGYAFIAKYASEYAKDIMSVYFLNQLSAQYGVFLINKIGQQLGNEAFKKLLKDRGKDFVQGAIIDYGIQTAFNYWFTDNIDSFKEAASPENINWASVALSGAENTFKYDNLITELVTSGGIACLLNGWTDTGGFKDTFDYQSCITNIGIVFSVKFLAKASPFLKRKAIDAFKYGRQRLKGVLIAKGLPEDKIDDVLDSIENLADETDVGTTSTTKGNFLNSSVLSNLTTEVPSGNFINKTKFKDSAHKIDLPEGSDLSDKAKRLKELAEDVLDNGDTDVPGGSKTEEIQDILFEDAGYIRLDGKTGSNNGFDGLYIKGTVDDPMEIVIGEAKQWGSSGGVSVNAANTSTRLPQQMSDDWIENVAQRLRDSGKEDFANMLINYSDRINKIVTVVNKETDQVNLLKLGEF